MSASSTATSSAPVIPSEPATVEAHDRGWKKGWCEENPTAALTIKIIAILATLGASYALVGGIIGFAPLNQSIIHFYTHLTVSTAIIGTLLPALAITALALYIVHQVSFPCTQ